MVNHLCLFRDIINEIQGDKPHRWAVIVQLSFEEHNQPEQMRQHLIMEKCKESNDLCYPVHMTARIEVPSVAVGYSMLKAWSTPDPTA